MSDLGHAAGCLPSPIGQFIALGFRILTLTSGCDISFPVCFPKEFVENAMRFADLDSILQEYHIPVHHEKESSSMKAERVVCSGGWSNSKRIAERVDLQTIGTK